MGLCQTRAGESPKIPNSLKDVTKIALSGDEKTTCLSHQDEIKKLFPHLFGQPILTATSGVCGKKMCIGVVLSGGQAAGGHNVIAGLFDALKTFDKGSDLIGFLGGPGGIVDGQYVTLTEDMIAPYRNQGGFDMIGSGRVKIESDEQLQKSKAVIEKLGLDGLVVIGGDDSNTNAAVLAEYMKGFPVVGVPKTIDGDLQNAFVQISFGFDTATKIYSEMIGNICRDALSAKKYYHFIKLMGRSASHVALECALKTHPNYTCISEERRGLFEIVDEIAEMIEKRAKEGKNYGVILIPEGLIEFMPEMEALIKESASGDFSEKSNQLLEKLPGTIRDQLLRDRDPHGNVQVSHIQTEKLILHMVNAKINSVEHFFGYEGRCGLPSHFDANYCYALGLNAAVILAHDKSGYMSCITNLKAPVQQWEPAALPITSLLNMEERHGKMKPVIQKALVALDGEPYKRFAAARERWKYADDYAYPGPIQFYGGHSESTPKILVE